MRQVTLNRIFRKMIATPRNSSTTMRNKPSNYFKCVFARLIHLATCHENIFRATCKICTQKIHKSGVASCHRCIAFLGGRGQYVWYAFRVRSKKIDSTFHLLCCGLEEEEKKRRTVNGIYKHIPKEEDSALRCVAKSVKWTTRHTSCSTSVIDFHCIHFRYPSKKQSRSFI